ncbi:unnamed protein product [Gongylonema pulchrum]|uniref:G_PROTEIN_RECEP_F1_2 domain-containing protein n=1 Tax=Gongylonema pulchrum TaxID=637853 RepID=A0A183DXZ6_9BILA|nr:unnamed protein product [Gongylonema pulchrum]
MRTLELTAIFMMPFLLLGMFGNVHMLFATFRFSQLQNRNGILIALIAFFDFISELHESKSVIEIFFGKSLMPRIVCFRSIFLYSISFNMACVAVLFLAIDRFIAVWSPVRYRAIGTKWFILLAVVAGLAYSTPIVIINFAMLDDKVIDYQFGTVEIVITGL